MGQTGLHLHVSLEDRQNLNADAIQGELFSNVDTEEIKRGYRGTVASKVAGITYRQLDYWARKQIVEPSITPSHGSGSRRLYSFKDVVILAVSKKLLDAGVNLQNVTAAIGFLTQRSTDQLANVTIMCDVKTYMNAQPANRCSNCCKAVRQCSPCRWVRCGTRLRRPWNRKNMLILRPSR